MLVCCYNSPREWEPGSMVGTNCIRRNTRLPRRLALYVNLPNLALVIAINAECYHDLWHKQFGHLNMQCMQTLHNNYILSSFEMPSYYVTYILLRLLLVEEGQRRTPQFI
jgi:hypothetical protein